jgi:glycine/D-amino acid oxidase-like deaminating enzyme
MLEHVRAQTRGMESPRAGPSLPPDAATEPVWGELRAIPRPDPPPGRAEVCIVGGGISGVAALHWCRARDLDAVLLEREHLAAGASGRNAGFLLAGVAENYARAAAAHGRGRAAAIWQFTRENHRLVRALIATADVGYARRGSWTLAASAEEAGSLEEAATLLAEDGLPGRWTRELPAPLAYLRGGLFTPDDGEVDPVRLVAAIAAPHRSRIFEGVEVTALIPGGAGVAVRHSQGELRATRVIIATNAHASELVPSIPIAPVRAQMLATNADRGARLGPPAYAEWGYRYWRQLSDGRVLAGGMRHRARAEEVGTVCLPTATIQTLLDGELVDLGVTAPVCHRWAGIMGFSPDGLPLAGPLPSSPGVLLLGGYTGHGMGFAVHAARGLVDHLVDSTPIPGWLDPARAIPWPGAAG